MTVLWCFDTSTVGFIPIPDNPTVVLCRAFTRKNIFTVCNLTKAIRKAIFRGEYVGGSLTNHCYDVVNSSKNWRNYFFFFLFVTTGLQILALLKPSGMRQLSSELVHTSLWGWNVLALPDTCGLLFRKTNISHKTAFIHDNLRILFRPFFLLTVPWLTTN